MENEINIESKNDKINPLVIAIDFDGTVVTHEYPNIGKDIGAVPVLKKFIEAGHHIILWTMRSGKELLEAQNWFLENDIELYGVNVNIDQRGWSNSPKCYAQIYIDDAALGAPLTRDEALSDREFVDWETVEALLTVRKII